MNDRTHNPVSPDAARATVKEMFDRANAKQVAGQSDEADAICRAILAIDDNHFGASHLRGVLALRSGDPQSALEHIERAVALAPARADCRNSLGFVFKALGRRADAETAFRQAVERDPAFVEAHVQLGEILSAARRFPESEASYRRALALRPDHYRARINLGTSLCELRRFEEAVEQFRRAGEIRPDHAEPYTNLGHALRGAGRPEEAEAASRHALAIAPRLVIANLNRGLALQDLGRLDEALACYRRAQPADADQPKAVASEGILHLLRGNFAAGWEKYEARWRIGDLPPRDFDVAQWRGEPAVGKTICSTPSRALATPCSSCGTCRWWLRAAPR